MKRQQRRNQAWTGMRLVFACLLGSMALGVTAGGHANIANGASAYQEQQGPDLYAVLKQAAGGESINWSGVGTSGNRTISTGGPTTSAPGAFSDPILVYAILAGALLLVGILAFALLLSGRSRRGQPTVLVSPAPPMPVAPLTYSPPAPNTASGPFGLAEQQYQQLRNALATGQMTPEQYEAEARQVVVQDSQGRSWTMGTADGLWYVWDGQGWLQANPRLQ